MKLEVYRHDLKKEHAGINCGLTALRHFKDIVQLAIIAAGGATFFSHDRQRYNAILLPSVKRNDAE